MHFDNILYASCFYFNSQHILPTLYQMFQCRYYTKPMVKSLYVTLINLNVNIAAQKIAKTLNRIKVITMVTNYRFNHEILR